MNNTLLTIFVLPQLDTAREMMDEWNLFSSAGIIESRRGSSKRGEKFREPKGTVKVILGGDLDTLTPETWEVGMIRPTWLPIARVASEGSGQANH